jgi:MFS family permease
MSQEPLWRRLPGTVIILGFASFFTDFSSEMIYPLLPLFLFSVLGAGAVQLGIIEGVAESTASLLKVVSGWWTDRVQRRKPFLVGGYGLSGLVRPLIGLAQGWPVVLVLRFFDRVGKGIRTSPRDALIADVTQPGERGAAYGFHRAMDHAGAVVGPVVAAFLLHWIHLPLRSVFLWAAVPAGVVLVLLAFSLHDPAHLAKTEGHSFSFNKKSWQDLGQPYQFYLATLFVFTLGNSTDAFLLMRLSQAGLSASIVALLWSLHHVVKMTSTYWGGGLADRFRSRALIMTGWFFYAAIYIGFAWAHSLHALIILFLVYGLYYGISEPAERVLVSSLAPAHLRGTAFGYFHGIQGLAALPASVLFGLIWKLWGAPAAFITGAALASAACLLLAGYPKTPPHASEY